MGSPLDDLVIRAACVRQVDRGFIIAGDPQKDEDEIPHTHGFMWRQGQFFESEANFTAHTMTIIDRPEYGVMWAAQSGDYSVETTRGVSSGNIFDQGHPKPPTVRHGLFRSLSTAERVAYAVGYRGLVYRFDDINTWGRIDDGLPTTFDVEALDGITSNKLYAVGLSGNVWTYDGNTWKRRDVPTNVHLACVKCVGDTVYIGGKQGILLRGSGDDWEIIDHASTDSDIWDIEFFKGNTYASTMDNVYVLNQDELTAVDFAGDAPTTCYKLDAIPDSMWSVGAKDILAFDGSDWQRIV